MYRSNEPRHQKHLQRKVREKSKQKQVADHPNAPAKSEDNTTEGFNVVYNFADDLANDAKVIKDQRTYIVMSIGLSNIFGRLIIGSLGDLKWVNCIYLFILTMIISGVATMAAPLCDSSVIQHIGYASFFGFFSGGSVALTPLVLTEIAGDKKLTNALGLSSLFVGVAVAIGTPVVGGMRDAFSHFARPFLWPYLVFGGCTVFSGIILFPAVSLSKKRKREEQREQREQQMAINSKAVSSRQDPNCPEQRQEL
ncbi:unnamed protein product [Adineta steineri]|uniref:Major facilitator superfamily (MFS) profile domain-containing protein n=1 Tax=Adineta steineri TaxID=433720 RepID=A0A815NPY2_9BILA|nr:unnamed protein product [Adineta steineri]CAF1441219.1 unnamed protein product [Adineta steineri]